MDRFIAFTFLFFQQLYSFFVIGEDFFYYSVKAAGMIHLQKMGELVDDNVIYSRLGI